VIAYTWDHFVRDPSQPEWLVRFPMVKAAYRAMDTMTAFASQKFGYSLDYYMVAGTDWGDGWGQSELIFSYLYAHTYMHVCKFSLYVHACVYLNVTCICMCVCMCACVSPLYPTLTCTCCFVFRPTGASKRGWTTWDVGAVDAAGPTPGRVAAIVPIVLDAINFVKVMHHQYRSYGNWSFALKDYAAMNFMNKIDNPNTLLMQQEIDPFFYINLGRLTMPKFLVFLFNFNYV
jgi:PhoPQ-activated pathogenicity-related protein